MKVRASVFDSSTAIDCENSSLSVPFVGCTPLPPTEVLKATSVGTITKNNSGQNQSKTEIV